MGKFYTGNIMMCFNYNKDKKEDNFNNSALYIQDAFFYKLNDNSYFHIEDGPDGELTHFISLIPEESLKSGEYILRTEPACPFDMYIDAKSLKSYLLVDKDNNPIK